MTTRSFKGCTLACLALALLSSVAAAQTGGAILADIPFRFIVNDTTLPAGSYIIEKLQPWEFVISSAKGEIQVAFLAEPTDLVKAPKTYELIFNSYGGTYFLSKIWLEDEQSGYSLSKTRMERSYYQKGNMNVQHVPARKK